ncbi:unnamed protein product [Adineta steineri]|uniref:Caspase family p20 domain-containing protein n=2 Tax=Adineta steineri TaxID=433720 RepID=A0A819V9R2_9BILA|nr:unnamed protein product [Adineta steineri]CAF4105900.1 unnamed protein product [Adineta steineri]
MFDKQALVIGNDDYLEQNKLLSCIYDAKTVTRSLRSIGFNVQPAIDLRNDQMLSVTRRFARSIRPGATVLFYFSGHAGEFNGRNYLYAVDSSEDNAVNVQDLLRELHQNRPKVVICILDGCRNPILSLYLRALGLDGRSRLRNDLAPMGGPPSTIIAFSSAAGKTSDAAGPGENSLYTKYLLRYITTPNMDIDILLKHASVDVQRASMNSQIPYLYTNCNEPICLNVMPGHKSSAWPNVMQLNPLMMIPDRLPHKNQYVTQSIWPHYDHANMINNQYPMYENSWYNTMMYPYTYTYL